MNILNLAILRFVFPAAKIARYLAIGAAHLPLRQQPAYSSLYVDLRGIEKWNGAVGVTQKQR
jgi:hypothetical protein